MAVITLKAFTGSVKNRSYTGERYNICVNVLSPSNGVQCDAYATPFNPWSTNHSIAIFADSISKLNTLLGGTASAIAVHKFASYGDHDDLFNHIYTSYKRTDRLLTRQNWENPINGMILVPYSHWYTRWKNKDVTFENFEPDSSDVSSTSYMADGLHYYTATGGYCGKLEKDTSIILFIRPTDTYSADSLYYYSDFYFARFSTWTQWSKEDYDWLGSHYFSPDGTPWVYDESHDVIFANTTVVDNQTIVFTPSKANNWGQYLFGNLGILPTIYWDGDYDKEIYYKGRYHKSGWLYENGQWTHAWERCPYEGFDE